MVFLIVNIKQIRKVKKRIGGILSKQKKERSPIKNKKKPKYFNANHAFGNIGNHFLLMQLLDKSVEPSLLFATPIMRCVLSLNTKLAVIK